MSNVTVNNAQHVNKLKLQIPTVHQCVTFQLVSNGKCWQPTFLEVPVSRQNHHYLLVVMDYSTKWIEAIPLRDQTAAPITKAIIKICSSFGIPSILHSDQGRIFE